MRNLVTLLILVLCTDSLQAQLLPWRRQIERRLQQQHELILQLLQHQAEPPAPIAPLPPKQLLPPDGQPKQELPIPGPPKQELPAPGEPKQPLPAPGDPKQELPPQGSPKQPLPATPPAAGTPQGYTIIIRALYKGG